MTSSISIRTLSIALLSAALFSLPACNKKESSTGGGSPTKSGTHDAGGDHKDHGGDDDHAKHETASKGPAAGMKVAVEVKATGYTPKMVMAKAGEPLTLVFTRVTGEGCVEKLLIPSEGVKLDLPLNKPIEVTFTPKKSGNLEFSCGMKMIKGTIMVH
jgi:Cupredoxin-like domain